MTEAELNDLIVETFDGHNHFADIFTAGVMTIGEALILINLALEKNKQN